jgi:hypothetical protein
VSYYVKVCPKCKAQNHPSMTYCAKCGGDLPSIKQESDTKPIDPPAYAAGPAKADASPATQPQSMAAQANTAPIQCRIVDIDLPFWSMVNFMVKWAVAAIPALIILIILAFFAVAILSAVAS